MWGTRWRGRRSILFVDNDAARHALIKGYTSSLASARLVASFWEGEAALASYCWVERVPSPSNIADGPSRLCFDEVVALGGRVVEPPRYRVEELLLDLVAWA